MAGEQPPVAEHEDIFIPPPRRGTPKRYIKFDLSLETSVSAVQVIDIAKQVARTEGNRLPEA